MSVYYYTPLWTGEILPVWEGPEPDPDPGNAPFPNPSTTAPGMIDGASTVQADPMPDGISKIHYDVAAPRCVVEVATSQTIDGWVEQTQLQIDAEYPGVF